MPSRGVVVALDWSCKLPKMSASASPLLPLLQNRPLFQAIYSGCLWARDNRWLLSRVQRLAGPAGETGAFCPGWWLHPGQKAHVPPLARLAFRTGTKTIFCPGPKGNRDKWPGTKAYSVVVIFICLQSCLGFLFVLWIRTDFWKGVREMVCELKDAIIISSGRTCSCPPAHDCLVPVQVLIFHLNFLQIKASYNV